MEKGFLKDSGERTTFESGAVRDLSEGKGRCDLLPLGIVGRILDCEIFLHLNYFVRTGDSRHIQEAVDLFIHDEALNGRYMCKEDAILDVAIHYEDGALKYSDRNWEKGIPHHCFIDSGVRHLLKHKAGHKDEPHHRAFLWNMLGLLWTIDYGSLDLFDLPHIDTDNENIASIFHKKGEKK